MYVPRIQPEIVYLIKFILYYYVIKAIISYYWWFSIRKFLISTINSWQHFQIKSWRILIHRWAVDDLLYKYHVACRVESQDVWMSNRKKIPIIRSLEFQILIHLPPTTVSFSFRDSFDYNYYYSFMFRMFWAICNSCGVYMRSTHTFQLLLLVLLFSQ